MEGAEARRVPGAVLGMVLFICSEIMFFGGLFAALFALRAEAPSWPPAGVELDLLLPFGLTAILLASSATVHVAVERARAGRDPGAWLLATIALGSAFLAGQLFEYSELPFALGDSLFGTLFFTITGFHGLHVAIGLVILGVAAAQLKRTRTSGIPVGDLEAASLYWHFVDAIWLLVLTAVYLGA